MHPPTNAPSPTPPERTTRSGVAAAATLLGSTGLAAPGHACPAIEPDASASVSIEIAPGVEDEIRIAVFEDRDQHSRLTDSKCYANVSVELSAFASISSRLDTHGVARAIRESAAALGADTCEVSVWYEDDADDRRIGLLALAFLLALRCQTNRLGLLRLHARSFLLCSFTGGLLRLDALLRVHPALDHRREAGGVVGVLFVRPLHVPGVLEDGDVVLLVDAAAGAFLFPQKSIS